MAWSASDVFAYAVLQMGSKALNLTSDSYKVALYASNTMTPDRTVSTAVLTEYNGAASQWVTANESSGTGYSAGGTALVTPTWLQASNVLTFTGANPAWASPTTLTAYGCLVYDSSVSNEGLSFNWLGGLNAVVAGSFSVTWSGSGILTMTV